MKTKRFLSFVTALTMTVSTFVSVHTVSAAQAEEDILTWDEIKTYVETTSPLVLGGSIYTDETGKYYYTGYGEKPTYVENGDYFILKSTAPGNKSAKHAKKHIINVIKSENLPPLTALKRLSATYFLSSGM